MRTSNITENGAQIKEVSHNIIKNLNTATNYNKNYTRVNRNHQSFLKEAKKKKMVGKIFFYFL